MVHQRDSEHYFRGLELAEAGRHQEALEHIEGYLRANPEDAEALNDAGAILHCLGRSDEAIEHFLRARNTGNGGAEILWNLCEAYISLGRAGEAAELFEEMDRLNILNPDVVNRTASAFLEQGDKGGAIETLLLSLQLAPEQHVLSPMVEVIRSKRPKIAFFCGGDGMTFLKEIVEFAERRFQVRVFDGQSDDELFELMQWSDISWFEWCTNLAVAASNKPKVCRSIVRLHRYEAYEHWPRQVNWENVDVLVTVGNSLTLDALRRQVPGIEERTSVVSIPNGINLKRFPYFDRRRGKNIAFLGNLRMVKNPGFVLQCMQKLHYIDPEYRLFFAGASTDQVLEQYLRHMVERLGLRGVVFFDGWQQDVSSWLADKHYIVSTSICEGHPVGILEGMSCGLKPVIHNFPGAEQMFPKEFLFDISEQFCQQVLSEQYEPRRYREFVEQNYSLKRQLRAINDLFVDIERQIDSELERVRLPAEAPPAVFAERGEPGSA